MPAGWPLLPGSTALRGYATLPLAALAGYRTGQVITTTGLAIAGRDRVPVPPGHGELRYYPRFLTGEDATADRDTGAFAAGTFGFPPGTSFEVITGTDPGTGATTVSLHELGTGFGSWPVSGPGSPTYDQVARDLHQLLTPPAPAAPAQAGPAQAGPAAVSPAEIVLRLAKAHTLLAQVHDPDRIERQVRAERLAQAYEYTHGRTPLAGIPDGAAWQPLRGELEAVFTPPAPAPGTSPDGQFDAATARLRQALGQPPSPGGRPWWAAVAVQPGDGVVRTGTETGDAWIELHSPAGEQFYLHYTPPPPGQPPHAHGHLSLARPPAAASPAIIRYHTRATPAQINDALTHAHRQAQRPHQRRTHNPATFAAATFHAATGLALPTGQIPGTRTLAAAITTRHHHGDGQRPLVPPTGPADTGLASPHHITQYLDQVDDITDWDTLTTDERINRLTDAANKRLTQLGIPPMERLPAPPSGSEATFEALSTVGQPGWLLTVGEDTAAEASLEELAATIYHEARHAEQWFLMLRLVADGNLARLHDRSPRIPENVRQAAARWPLVPGTAEHRTAMHLYDARYEAAARTTWPCSADKVSSGTRMRPPCRSWCRPNPAVPGQKN